MIENKLNCLDDYCKYCSYDGDDYVCELSLEIKDEDCEYFEYKKCCNDCKHVKRVIYETGTIDEIDYYCKLQDDKLIYQDVLLEPCCWPECPIGKFEKRK